MSLTILCKMYARIADKMRDSVMMATKDEQSIVSEGCNLALAHGTYCNLDVYIVLCALYHSIRVIAGINDARKSD